VFSFKKNVYKPTVISAIEDDSMLETIRRETSIPPCLTPIPSEEEQQQTMVEAVKSQDQIDSST
jgi:hypothetical protein